MTASPFYHDGSRALQDQFDTRRLADHWQEKITRSAFSDIDKEFIENALFFFLATADASGRPDCSFKGGMPGFVRVTGPSELTFPDYDGNGMFRSLGNIRVNPSVGLLFIIMGETPRRLRVNGEATITRDDPSMGDFAGAQLLVRVTITTIFPNCPRYIPSLAGGAPSQYAPRAGYEPPEPDWKEREGIKEKVPRRTPPRLTSTYR